MSRRLEVRLHGLPVGQLSETPDGVVEFRLLDSYRQAVPRPVLGQKFEDDLDRVHRSRRGQGLPDFFANLVPERGRLRDLIVEHGGLDPLDELALLAFVGEDLPGAVVVRPVGEDFDRPAAARSPGHGEMVEPVPGEPQENSRNEEEPPGERLHFSLAGVQLKFSMLLEGDKLTLPLADRGGEWIVKFDSPAFRGLPENEFSMLEWARAAGFDVPETRLYPADRIEGFPRRFALEESRVLAVRRFDRTEKERIHQEDMAQAVGLPPARKYELLTYEAMARLVRRFIGEEAVGELVRRLTFVIASGNNDAHLKNWSLLYRDRIRATWSPLYDQVATVAWAESGAARELSLKLAGAKEFGRLDRAACERFADKAGEEVARVVDEVDATLERLRATWREIGGELPLPEEHREALEDHWQRVPLLREAGFGI